MLPRLPTLLRATARRTFTSTASQWRSAPAAQQPLLSSSSPDAATEGIALSKIERLMKLTDSLSRNGQGGQLGSLRGTPSVGPLGHADEQPIKENLAPLPTTRTMKDSYVELDLKFSECSQLREQYVGGLSKVRMGRLMEDFDSLAGQAAYKYVLPDGCSVSDAHHYGIYLVTAAVDRMDVLKPLSHFDGKTDLRLSGYVAYATESSLEVFVRLSTLPASGESETVLIGRFAMACRKYSGGKQPIAKLEVVGEAEEELWKMGKEMKEGKKARTSKSLEKSPPNEPEAKLMHELFVGQQDIFKRNAPTPADVVWMSDTDVNSAQLMHPQESNVHGKIFGGYLMRLSYETAYSTACLFARTPVTFIALDELRFAQPVEIGSLLRLDSRVTYSPIKGEHKSFHVSVTASTTDLYTGEKKITNTFHYTFASETPLQRHVLPRSYRQAMQWLDAQRRRELGVSVRKAYSS